MLGVHENKITESKKVSIRYDNSTRTYYCFYHKANNLSLELILSYEINTNKWIVDTIEYKNIFEKELNQLFNEKNLPFEEQLRYVINYLDGYFEDQSQQKKTKINVINHCIESFPWFRRFRRIRRWTSQNILTERSTILQRSSVPIKSTYINNQDEIISVKSLAESFYTDDINRFCTKKMTSSLESLNKIIPNQISNKAPPITEIWLNVITHEMNDFQNKIGNSIEENKLKKLSEKFVTYFSGTFQCNLGHQYQLEYDDQTWYFTVCKVEFLKNKTYEITKLPKTKIIFLIDDIPHYVRG